MRRALKFLMKLALAILAVGLTFFLIFLNFPPWQQAVVEKALTKDSGRRWQLESIDFGLHSIEAKGIFMLEGSVGAEVSEARIEGPFWKALLGRLQVDSGEVNGFYVDLSKLRVGDLTSSDWQSFLSKVSSDVEFWQERLGLVLQKIGANGYDVRLRNLTVRGDVLMPGQRMIPVSMRIIEADSRNASEVKIRPVTVPPPVDL